MYISKGGGKNFIYNYMKICQNRNCNKDLINKRPQSLYCSRKCKNYENKYRNRDLLKIKKLYDM